jgi:hypothetical protein
MRTIPEIADRLPEAFDWPAARGIEPAGAPFLRYFAERTIRDGHSCCGT